MRIVIDRDLCEANERCMKVAPDVFHVDDDGELTLLVDDDIPAELQDRVAKAVQVCPRGALKLVNGNG